MKNIYIQLPPKYRKGLWPYVGMGMGVVFLLAAIIIFSWLFIWGVLIGLVLYAIAWLRLKLFPKPSQYHMKKTEYNFDFDPKTNTWHESDDKFEVKEDIHKK